MFYSRLTAERAPALTPLFTSERGHQRLTPANESAATRAYNGKREKHACNLFILNLQRHMQARRLPLWNVFVGQTTLDIQR